MAGEIGERSSEVRLEHCSDYLPLLRTLRSPNLPVISVTVRPGKETLVKRTTLGSVLLIGFLTVGVNAYAQPTQCRIAAWSPEVITFYGDSATVAEKLAKVQDDLVDRRVYLLVAETSGRTEAALFERKDGENLSLSRWEANSNIELASTLNDKLLANAGAACAGELARTFLETLGTRPASEVTIQAPSTALAAYQQALHNSDKSYVRLTLFFLC